MIEYLTLEDLLVAAEVAMYPDQPRIRDVGALASAAARPGTTVFGQDAYPTLADKAAAILHSIVRNHPLVDGNKRLGWLATVGTCEINGYDLQLMDQVMIYDFVVAVATGELDVDEAAKFIVQHLSCRA